MIPEELLSYLRNRGLRLDRDDDAKHYRSTYFGKTAESMNGYGFYHVAVASLPPRTQCRGHPRPAENLSAQAPFCALLKLLSKLCEFLFQVRDFILEPGDFFFQLSYSVAVNGTVQSVRLDL